MRRLCRKTAVFFCALSLIGETTVLSPPEALGATPLEVARKIMKKQALPLRAAPKVVARQQQAERDRQVEQPAQGQINAPAGNEKVFGIVVALIAVTGCVIIAVVHQQSMKVSGTARK